MTAAPLRWLLLPAVAALAGCGGPTNTVAGTVVRDGQPVETGVVVFVPDLDKGNDGPTCTLLIRGGRFSSVADGVAMRSGPHRVNVSVPSAVSPDYPSEDHHFQTDVPAGGTEELVYDVTPKKRTARDRRR